MRVAKFKHGGHISAIQSTCRAIFGDCLARHGLRPAQGVDLIEVYGLDFDPISGFGTVGLWVPVV
jgi:predicted transcriptional regulator YdeE